ncbi:hypothetical protein [Mycobacterium sp. NPDC050853]
MAEAAHVQADLMVELHVDKLNTGQTRCIVHHNTGQTRCIVHHNYGRGT